ncbi:flavin reductase [Mesorhizobium sp. NBSH29]|uniref:flavin reductase family protein n=1 Tax=Mesorhizobium sp. NBSH29 TaxID=2654249 RepID=UPI001896740A|nr:flavin reductase family protein [Mesorhizobium sp. NBSH29]QPC86368.1 flavin reductase [Mesorhizobium sp. NBSH29]
MTALAAPRPAALQFPPTIDPRGFKQGMRALAGAVAVLAAEDETHGSRGLTATAICSFSADPASLLVCINTQSSITPMLREGLSFSVNLPGSDQDFVARAFGGMTVAKGVSRFASGSWVRGANGAPVLVGARAVFECHVSEIIARASHLIVIGLVSGVTLDREDRAALLYSDGSFATTQKYQETVR